MTIQVPESFLRPKEGEQPIDMGCGYIAPVRTTNLAVIGVYHYLRNHPTRLQNKILPVHIINLTLAGTWQFAHGHKRHPLSPGCVNVGIAGAEYGCAHSAIHPNSNFIVGLAPNAIEDAPEPLFKTPVMIVDDLDRYIVRAAGCTDDEEFHSRMYQIFDYVSHCSYKGERREVRNLLRTARLKRFIEHHLTERITLEDLARSVGINPYTCLRQFKAATGETPFSYIARCRVDRAKVLLKSDRISIDEVGHRAGFPNHSYFSRMFKRYTGLSPSDYRRLERRA